MIAASHPFRPRTVIVILCLATLLVSCASPRLAYPRLDWLAAWKLGQYVKLDASQEQRFEAAFGELWDWHRREELPRYGADLRALAARVEHPLATQDVAHWAQRTEAHSQRLLARGLPAACSLMAGFNDAQRDSVLAKVDERLVDDREKYLDGDEARQRKAAATRTRQFLERWIGGLSAPQEAMVARWSATRPARLRQWLEQRQRWRSRFAAALEQRAQPGFCAQLEPLFLRPGEAGDGAWVEQPHAQPWFTFLAEVSSTLSERQRTHLRDKLLAYADDTQHLAQR